MKTEGVGHSLDALLLVAIYKSIVYRGAYSMLCTANALLTSGDCRDAGVAEIWHIIYRDKFLKAMQEDVHSLAGNPPI